MRMPENVSGLRARQGAADSTAAARAPGGAGPEPVSSLRAEQASPQEQQMYERVVKGATRLLYDKKRMDQTIDALNTSDPREGVATVTAALIGKVIQAAAKAGDRIPFDVVLHASAEVFDAVAEMAQEAGVHDFDKDQQMTAGAFVRAFDKIRVQMQEAGLIDKDEAAAMLQEAQAMDAQSRQGGNSPSASAPQSPPSGGGAPQPAPAAGSRGLKRGAR